MRGRPTDLQNGNAGERKREEEEHWARFYTRPLPQFSGLDAVGWGAATVVLLQFARHLHLQLFQHHEPQEGDASSQPSIPGFSASTLTPDQIKFSQCILPHGVVQGSPSTDLSTPAEGPDKHFKTGWENFEDIEQDDPLFVKSSTRLEYSGMDGSSLRPPVQREEPYTEAINQATSDMQGAAESSISSTLNLIGIKSIKAEDDDMAFSCFMMAARQGYSKAQYNAGVCFELGRGTAKDLEKANLYYSQAAVQGHTMAQYRWARYLLEVKPGRDVRDTRRATEQLEKAAKSGLQEAQAYLGVFYTNEPHQDPQKAVRYFSMASRSGDPTSHYHLGICYQTGWGVLKDSRRAVDLYKQAAALGHPGAQCVLGTFHQEGVGGLPLNLCKAMELYQKAAQLGSEEAAHNLYILMKKLQVKGGFGPSHGCSPLRCVASCPCMLTVPLPQQPECEANNDCLPPDAPATLLPHSWSTGSLYSSPLTIGDLCVSQRPPEVVCQLDVPVGRSTFLVSIPGVG
ncbi:death ligand signal enhancer isoform X2 [Narcine bancroftii]|uniref:death ligand signal enhancer isoform X2 n=1 Tax=Narcine bancroftii TaxID=1343680 RepID=UPI0038310E87